MKKVISYSLFGADAAKYAKYLPAVIRAHLALFPREEGWVMALHADKDVYLNAVRLEMDRFVNLSLIPSLSYITLCKAMLWRLAPLFYPEVDVVFCRDLDALPTPRDRAACDEFIASNADVHVIHDRPVHDGMLGGLCGFKSTVRTSLAEYADTWGATSIERFFEQAEVVTRKELPNFDWTKKGADQDALNCYIAPAFSTLVHAYPGQTRRGWFAGMKNVEWRVTPQFGTVLATPALNLQAEALAPYLGCDGFDIEAAVKFYNSLGLPDIAAVKAAER